MIVVRPVIGKQQKNNKDANSDKNGIDNESNPLTGNKESEEHVSKVTEEGNSESREDHIDSNTLICNENITTCFLPQDKSSASGNNFENEDHQAVPSPRVGDETENGGSKSVELSSLTLLENTDSFSESKNVSEHSVPGSVSEDQCYLTKDATEHQITKKTDFSSLADKSSLTSLTLCHGPHTLNGITTSSHESNVQETILLVDSLNSDGDEHHDNMKNKVDAVKNQLHNQQQPDIIVPYPIHQNDNETEKVLNSVNTEHSQATLSISTVTDHVQCAQESVSVLTTLNCSENCENTMNKVITCENHLYSQQQLSISDKIAIKSIPQNDNHRDDLLPVVQNVELSENTLAISIQIDSDQVQNVQENISLLTVVNSSENCENTTSKMDVSENHSYSQKQPCISESIRLLPQQCNSDNNNDLLSDTHTDETLKNTLSISDGTTSDEVPSIQENILLLHTLNSSENCENAPTEMDISENPLHGQQQPSTSENATLQSQQCNDDNNNTNLISDMHTDESLKNTLSISNGTISGEVPNVQENISLLTVLNSGDHYKNTGNDMDNSDNHLYSEQLSTSENNDFHSQQSNIQENNLSVIHAGENSEDMFSTPDKTVSEQTTKKFDIPLGSTLDSLFDSSISASWYLPEPDGSLALNQYVNIPEELTEGQADQQDQAQDEQSKDATAEMEEAASEQLQSEEDWNQKPQFNLKYTSSLNYKPLSLELYNKIRETFGQTECEVCGRLFHSRLDLEPHLLTHAENKPFKCDKCPYSAATKDNLKRHQETVHERRTFPCEQCEYVASSRTSLWHHRQKHLATAAMCQICDQTFPTPRSLREHVLSKHPQVDRAELQKMLGANHRVIGRLGRRSYKCPYCERVFHRSSTDLQKHMWIHEGVKPYQCSLCSHTCRSRNNLNVHMLTHTADKPFLCSECGKAYKSKTALRSHIRTHTEGGIFNCDQCDYSSSQKCQLKKHSETHEATSIYTCEHCDYSSSILGYMKVHYARRHKGETFNESSTASETVNSSTMNVYIECLSCSHVFGSMSEMKNHLKEQHDVCVDDVDFSTEETRSIQPKPKAVACSEEVLVDNAVSEPLTEGVQMVQLQEVDTVNNILPAASQELHLTTSVPDGAVDEKMASTVNIIQQIFEQGALDSQGLLQLLDGQCLVAMKPETIIVQEDGQEVLLNGSSTEGGQYVIQYVTQMPDTPIENEMTIQTSDIVDQCVDDSCTNALDDFQVQHDTSEQERTESDKTVV